MDFTIEELSMNAWPALQTLLYDGWIIRFSDGYGNRGNSVNPIYPSRINLEEKLACCDDLFSRRNLPAAYKIVGCEEYTAIEKRLEELNYNKINETSIQTCKIGERHQNDYERISIHDNFDEEWIQSAINFNRIDRKHVPAFTKIVGNIVVEKIVVKKIIGGEIAGCGYGAIENNYVGVFDIVVKEELRGKGYGREIVGAIMAEAAKRGIKKSYLQVMINNPAALHLYEKMGFREIYRYWYRKKAG